MQAQSNKEGGTLRVPVRQTVFDNSSLIQPEAGQRPALLILIDTSDAFFHFYVVHPRRPHLDGDCSMLSVR